MPKLYTTLNAIREHGPCEDGWEMLLAYLGKTRPDDEPLALATILESNGVLDAAWCLRALPEEHDGLVRLFLADVAERVLPIFEETFSDNDAPRKAIQAARDYVGERISAEELAARRGDALAAINEAREDTRASVWGACGAAWAALYTAHLTARVAAWGGVSGGRMESRRARGPNAVVHQVFLRGIND